MKENKIISILTGGAFLLMLSACEPDNLPPEADAGPDLVVVPPDNKTDLAGSATDADGAIVAYQWTQVSGPAGATLADAFAATTRVEGLVEGTYVFQLLAVDNEGLWDTDEVTVWVGDPCYGCWDY